MFEIDYSGFTPDEDIQDFAHSMLRRLIDEVPFDCSGKANLIKADRLYVSSMIVRSRYGTFTASAIAPGWRQALERIEMQVSWQLMVWQALRGQEAAQDELTDFIRASVARRR